VEGSQSQALGRFVSFLREFFRQVRGLSVSRTLEDWAATLQQLLGRLLAAEEPNEAEFQLLRGHLQQLARFQLESGFERKVSLSAIRYFLERRLASQLQHHSFLSGGVTFCAMLPMRSIPARVIALVGMNHDAYPRRNHPPGFDLMANHPRPGDRSLGEEDRYIFLEALLSTRDRLYLSYRGQNQRDNNEVPPAVCLSELLDYIKRSFAPPPGHRKAEDHLVFRHRLQAFSPEYFSAGSRLFSYSRENREALAARIDLGWSPRPWLASSLGDPPEELRLLELEDFVRFFTRPVEYFLRNRLGIRIEKTEGIFESTEPFELNKLEEFLLKEELLDQGLLDLPAEQRLTLLKSRGLLPPGTPGRLCLEKIASGSEAFRERLSRLQTGEEMPPFPVDFSLGPFRIKGSLRKIWPQGQICWRAARTRAQDLLALWIRHLLLNSESRAGYPRSSFLLTEKEKLTLPEIHDSPARLSSLLEFYWDGLRRPLPFFPETSHAYAMAIHKGKAEGEAFEAARKKWEPQFDRAYLAESRNAYHALAFREVDPLDQEFARVALAIFLPLLEVLAGPGSAAAGRKKKS